MVGIDGILKDGDKKGELEFVIVLFCYIFVQWFYWYNFYLFNYIFLYIENIYIVLFNVYVCVSNWNFFQCFQNYFVDGVCVIFWQVLVKCFIDFLDVGGIVNND